MAINFPNDSATGATYNYAGLNYTYDGLRWAGKLAVVGSTGAQGSNGTDFQGVTSTAPVDIDNTDPLNPVISVAQSDAGNDGFLSSVDWNTFNNKGSSNFGGIPAWTSAGAITFGATTTAPTKPTARVQDNISYRRLGDKQWEVVMSWLVTTATGSANGTGDYLFTLPNSLSFDTTLPSQQIYTNGVASNSWNTASYIIPSGSGLINNGTVGGQVYPLVYNGTTFRILTTSYASAVQCWGAGYYGAACPGMQLSFRFTST